MTDLEISGGSSGVGAHLDDLGGVARMLDRAGDDLRELSRQTVQLAASCVPIGSALLSPVTAAAPPLTLTEAGLGPSGLLAAAVRVEAVGFALAAARAAYLQVDRSTAALFEQGQTLVGLPLTAAHLAGTWVAGEVLRRTPDLPGPVGPWLQRLAEEGGTPLERLQYTVYDEPWRTDVAIGGLRALTAAAGYEQAAVRVLALARDGLGYFDDSAPVRARPVRSAAGAAHPRGVAGVFDQQQQLLSPEGRQRIRISRTTTAHGAGWVVQLPGTQQWHPQPRADPFDLTTNMVLMAGGHPAVAGGVTQALAAAMEAEGVEPGSEPVLLTGHSQGGILAAHLAGTPGFRSRFDVTHVITGGAPIARELVPDGVTLLAVEHDQDPVVRADQADNPDRPNVITVARDLDLTDPSWPADDQDDPGHPPDTAGHAHESLTYRRTGALIDASHEPSLVRWRRDVAAFFTGRAEVWDYELRRGSSG